MNKESNLLKKFLLEYSRLGSRLFRNNTGMGWTGLTNGISKKSITITINPGDMVIRKARPFHAGFPKGSADLIGWTKIQITPNMVGREVAVFTAVEAKTENVRATKEQTAFINTVNQAGGIAMIARKLQDIFTASTNFIGGDDDEARH